MDNAILKAVLLDNNGSVDVEVLASLLRRIRKVVGVRALSSHPGWLAAHGAGHLATGLSSPEGKACTRRDTGERFWRYEGSVEVDGEKVGVTLFCNDESTLRRKAEREWQEIREEVARG